MSKSGAVHAAPPPSARLPPPSAPPFPEAAPCANVRADDVQPHAHPVREQLPGVAYCVNTAPPWPEAIASGFQHHLLTLGLIVLISSFTVPLMGGGDREKAKVVQTMLFVSGWSTLFQTLFGTRLPSIVGVSYAYVIPITSIALARHRQHSTSEPLERFFITMRAIQGALLIAGCFQVFVSFSGFWRNAVRLLSPLSLVPYVTFTGLGLYHLGFPLLARCVEIGLPGLFLFMFFLLYLPRYLRKWGGVIERFSPVFSVAIVWFFAEILTLSSVYNHKNINTQNSCRTDRAGLISTASWVSIPYPFQWGSPIINAGESFAMIAASVVSMFESTGTFFATARYGSATPVPPSVVSRGTGWLGVGVLLNGIFGGISGFTASVENAGLLALTKVGSRRVIQIAACFMIFFSMFGKIGALFASIPLPIVAALYCVLCGYICSAGLSFLQFCNLNSFRTNIILGFSVFISLSLPQYIREHYWVRSSCRSPHSGSCWFQNMFAVLFSSHATVAALVSTLLDLTLARNNDESKRDSGLKWWERFSLYKSDIRNSEFYALPWMLSKYFPSV